MSLHGNDVCLLEVDDYNLYEEEASDHAVGRSDKGTGSKAMEAEKRIRREIANSNERRRMQSINAGFQALRTLLPRHEGEKLSKAAILQQTAEYIYSLEQEKTRLLSQNCQLKRLLNQHEGGEVPLKKRKSEIITHSSPIITADSTEDSRVPTPTPPPEPVGVIAVTSIKKDDAEVKTALEREKRMRLALEDRLQALETRVYPTTDAPVIEESVKDEPRVKVEVVEAHDSAARLYLANTSRQNLETIVEAIRHLEGDHLFDETREPLALTKRMPPPAPRPGVIVVKHS